MKLFKICLFALLLAGCATAPKSPKAMQDKFLHSIDGSGEYPAEDYLSALGNGDTYEDAKRMAQGNLAKIFRADIVASSKTLQKYSEILNAEGLRQDESASQESSVEVSSSQSLVNVKFAGKYKDDKKKVHTLAYIDRKETAKIYEQRISDNEDDLSVFVSKAKSSNDILQKYGCYRAALAYSKINRGLLEQLQIISPKDAQMTITKYSYSELSSIVRELGKQITYAVSVQGDEQDAVKGMTERVMYNLDFSGSNNPLLKIEGKVSFAKENLNKSTKFYRWTLALKIVRTDKNLMIFSLDKVGRDGALSYERAKQVSYYQMRKLLGENIKAELDAYFDSRL